MTNPPDKPKRWRPKFSVRTLVVLVTLLCAYFGLWDVTSRYGTCPLNTPSESAGVRRYPYFIAATSSPEATCPAPLVVVVDEMIDPRAHEWSRDLRTGGGVHIFQRTRTSYLWLFGPRFAISSTVLRGPFDD